jgi:putative flavoprotein involved in K+ transport
MTTERFETVIVGGGQAGLATGYHLAKQGRPFVILDGFDRVGDAWRTRWDSLRVFTPAKYNGLPGWRFPAPSVSFPTKDEMADYLEAYAKKFELPVRTGVRAERLVRSNGSYVVTAGGQRIEADNVVIACGAHQIPKTPAFGADLDPDIVQLHSVAYKGPQQLRDGGVLIVGLGNSGAEIAYETVKTHKTWVSGKPTAEIPFKHGPAAARFGLPLVKFVGSHVLTMRNPIGRKAGPSFVMHAAPLIRVKVKDLVAAGVEQVGRTAGSSGGLPILDDGRTLDVANVIWCTGFRYGFDWIDVPVFTDSGAPIHDRGVANASPGLYFMGLLFQFAATSDVLPGVGRDAKYVARHIAARAAK